MNLPIKNLYYNANIENSMNLYDFGDLELGEIEEKSFEKAQKITYDAIDEILKIKNSFSIMIGGTNDCSIGTAISFSKNFKYFYCLFMDFRELGWLCIHIDGSLDCSLEPKGIHSESAYLKVHELAYENNGKIISYGCQTMKTHDDEYKFVLSKNGQVMFLKKDIRKTHDPEQKICDSKITLKTAAAIKLHKILEECANMPIFISWDLSSLQVFFLNYEK